MRVLGLCTYPVEAAATRFRLSQLAEPLREQGIRLEIRPFLDSRRFARLYSQGSIKGALSLVGPLLNRIRDSFKVRDYDLIMVQREAMFFGPEIFERLFETLSGRPIILDLDDATYVRYVSPSYGRLGSALKFFGKTDRLIRRSAAVTCGNRLIAEYAESKGARAVVVPTVVDTDVFRPTAKANPKPVIGWIGTHSTYPFLEKIFPVMTELSKAYDFTLKIVGSGRGEIRIPNVEVENLEWSLEREVADFQSLDIGLYPIFPSASASEEWLKGKSGFKAIEYMAVGVPFVMSPVGICAEMGIPGVTHLYANDASEWYDALSRLIESADMRRTMSAEARAYSVANYHLKNAVRPLAKLFVELAE